MMPQQVDPHKVFADFFGENPVKGYAYALSQKLAEGHTCIDIQELKDKLSADNESIPAYIVASGLPSENELIENKWVATFEQPNQPFILHEGKLYLQRYFSYETEITNLINRLIKHEESPMFDAEQLLKKKEFILKLFADHTTQVDLVPEENINWQLVAAITAALSNFAIITGGPGTGKTTAIAKLLALMFALKPDIKIALAAPTGKAAARMTQSLRDAVIRGENGHNLFIRELPEVNGLFDQLKAGTLHRLLGFLNGTHYFKHNESNPLDYDVVIVDECSMIGAGLMAKLLYAIKPHSKLIMLGDKDQLASVDAGSIFGDICLTQNGVMNKISAQRAHLINTFITAEAARVNNDFKQNTPLSCRLQEHIIELKRSWRFNSAQGIGRFSQAVIRGELNDQLLENPTDRTDQYVQVCNDYTAPELNELLDGYAEYIKEHDIKKALQKMNEVRILCAVHSGNFGVNHYNMLISKYLTEKELLEPGDSFYENQPIMITKNNKEYNLFNGDVGLIRKDPETNTFKAWFEDSEKPEGYSSLPTSRLSEYTTVFAMTIHKSQGSEFNRVGIVLPEDENAPLLTRELIYTAITRAKEHAVIFSSDKVLKAGASRSVERASGITTRLMNE